MGIFARQFTPRFAPEPTTALVLAESMAVRAVARKAVVVARAEAMRRLVPSIAELMAQGYDVVCVGPTDFRGVWSLVWQLRRERPGLVLSCGLRGALVGTLAAWAARVPRRVVLIEGLSEAYAAPATRRERFVRWLGDRLLRLPASFADTVVVHNDDDRRILAQGPMLGRGSRVYVVPGAGVALDEIAPEPLPEGGPMTFVMIAPLTREKGVHEFAEAARRLKAQGHDVRFVLAGPLALGPQAVRPDEIGAWIADERLEYAGDAADARALLRESHVLVLPSHREGMPEIVMEAIAMGRPVIASDVPGCRQAVAHNKTGLLVRPKSPAALAEAMTLALMKRGLVNTWSRTTQVERQRFDNRALARDMAKVLADVPGG
jgi:glycosyltransferase involved in cell wall biosynthesis